MENQEQAVTEQITDINDLKPSEIEATLKDQTLAPEDSAAAFFQLQYPRYKAMIDGLSQNQLRRLCLNLAAAELTPIQNQLKSQEEKSAYYIASQMIQNRTIMQLFAEMEKVDKAQKQQELINAEQNNTETKTEQGETNV